MSFADSVCKTFTAAPSPKVTWPLCAASSQTVPRSAMRPRSRQTRRWASPKWSPSAPVNCCRSPFPRTSSSATLTSSTRLRSSQTRTPSTAPVHGATEQPGRRSTKSQRAWFCTRVKMRTKTKTTTTRRRPAIRMARAKRKTPRTATIVLLSARTATLPFAAAAVFRGTASLCTARRPGIVVSWPRKTRRRSSTLRTTPRRVPRVQRRHKRPWVATT